MNFFSGDTFKDLVKIVVGAGVGAIANNQIRQDAKGAANAKNEQLAAELKIAEQNATNILLAEQISKNKASPPIEGKSNTILYVGLGVGGVLVLATVIFVVTRK